jgi:hypothetical protein
MRTAPTRRSDSNGEDLEGYAGAGLYESVTTETTVRERVDYSADPIVTDPGAHGEGGGVFVRRWVSVRLVREGLFRSCL